MKRLLALFALLGLALAAPEVRVLLAKTPAFEVVLEGPHVVFGPFGPLFYRKEGARYRLERTPKGLLVNGQFQPTPLSFVPKKGAFVLGGQRYAGFLRVLKREGGLWLVNVVDLEAYVAGVLPGEMPASFPLEALKAQAVLARTYALEHLASHPDYDLCADASCQVYRGLVPLDPRYQRAIRATRGLLLAYRGSPAKALYHADSGGQTAAALEVWGRDFPYLKSRADPYTRKKPWRVAPDPRRVAAALKSADPGPFRFAVEATSPSGRIAGLRVESPQATYRLAGPEATRFLRAIGLPSTLAWVEGGRVFAGRGSGHGVGLSQWGAKGLAERGYNWREILGHYFPGTVIAPFVVEAKR